MFSNVHILMTTGRAISNWINVLGGLPDDGTPVPKLLGVDTYHDLYFMICSVLYFIECIY